MTPASTPLEPLDARKFVVALARGLELLRAFRPGETMLGNRDFVERTGLPKATVNRLAYTLTVLGYLRLDETLGKYALDAGVLSLGFALLSGTATLDRARGGGGGIAGMPRRARYDLSGHNPQRDRAHARPCVGLEAVHAHEFDGA